LSPSPGGAYYARYSSDRQREASIEVQVRLCEERAAHKGWKVVKHYKNQAISGASLMRPDIQALIRDAQGRSSISSSRNRSTASHAIRKTSLGSI
jgi:DNA invertase Pin-like site-specific DNA recombinase